MDPVEVQAVVHWERPKSTNKVRSFLGFNGYYYGFIQDFSSIVSPLTQLTRKEERLVWTNV